MGRWLPDPSFFFPTLDPLLRIKCSRTPHRKKRMTSLTDYAKNMLGRSVVGRRPTLPAAVFVAIGTGGSDASGVSGEPTGPGYARQAVTFFGTGLPYKVLQLRSSFTSPTGPPTHIGSFVAHSGRHPFHRVPHTTHLPPRPPQLTYRTARPPDRPHPPRSGQAGPKRTPTPSRPDQAVPDPTRPGPARPGPARPGQAR